MHNWLALLEVKPHGLPLPLHLQQSMPRRATVVPKIMTSERICRRNHEHVAIAEVSKATVRQYHRHGAFKPGQVHLQHYCPGRVRCRTYWLAIDGSVSGGRMSPSSVLKAWMQHRRLKSARLTNSCEIPFGVTIRHGAVYSACPLSCFMRTRPTDRSVMWSYVCAWPYVVSPLLVSGIIFTNTLSTILMSPSMRRGALACTSDTGDLNAIGAMVGVGRPRDSKRIGLERDIAQCLTIRCPLRPLF